MATSFDWAESGSLASSKAQTAVAKTVQVMNVTLDSRCGRRGNCLPRQDGGGHELIEAVRQGIASNPSK